MTPIIKSFKYGNHTVTLETGRIARQATGAVLCSIDDTSVLCTVVGAREAKPGMDFFPLGVRTVFLNFHTWLCSCFINQQKVQ